MDKCVSSLDATSNVLPLHTGQEECQPSVSRNQNDNQEDGEWVSCHMCAIEVPKRFINEHYKSNKHRINTKIADVALERLQKLMHYNIISDVNKTESLYFCPQCVITLHPKNRQSHEKSLMHKKALTVDKFLYDFYVLYANEDGDSNIARECEATVTVQSSVVEPVNDIDNASLNIGKIQLMNRPEKIEVKTDDSVGITNKNAITSGSLVNDTTNNYNEIKIQKTPNTPNTSVVDTSQFCTFEKNKTEALCKICKVYVPNKTSNLLSHQKVFKHKEVLRKQKNALSMYRPAT